MSNHKHTIFAGHFGHDPIYYYSKSDHDCTSSKQLVYHSQFGTSLSISSDCISFSVHACLCKKISIRISAHKNTENQYASSLFTYHDSY